MFAQADPILNVVPLRLIPVPAEYVVLLLVTVSVAVANPVT